VDARSNDGRVPTQEERRGLMGLARRIAKAGYASRRVAEEIVRAGRVQVDGQRILDPYLGVPEDVEIAVDGQVLQEVARVYFAFYKPLGVTTNPTVGQRGRLVSEFLPSDITGLRPAGRLDLGTTGLLLISNDNRWNGLAAAGNGHEKEFLLRVAGEISDLQLDLIASGVQIHKVGTVQPTLVKLEARNVHNSVIKIALREGKVRQLRALCQALRLELKGLHRIRIGPIHLGSLRPGKMRPLTDEEIEAIRRGAGQ